MCQAILHLLILMTLSCHSLAENETNATCPEHQRAFGGSCFEFVGIRRSFFSAQAWCEGNGGHLAFIPDEDTQYFLERHMDTKEDFWFGVAPSAEGHLSWLDGSPLTYSKWVSSPEPGAACGYILRNSGFHWEARNNCTKNRSFICQFESGRTIVCEGRNTTLQCGSGQVLMIDGGFYGRKSIHYCRSKFPPPASPQHECGWADAVESITARCHDRQVCQIAEVANSFADPCPQLKSYLSVDYHCKDGLALSVNPTAVVLGDVRIHVKWLLHSSLTNLSCRVNTGDGHVIYLNNPKGLENSVVHKYTHPSTFIVAAECTCSEMHITAQKIITIQEPVAEIGVITCYAGNLSFSETNCKALYGEAFHIQMEVSAGTNVTYRIESDEKSLSGLSVIRGTEPQNITVTSEMVTHLGSGCHHLTLYASNTVTFLEVSKDLQVQGRNMLELAELVVQAEDRVVLAEDRVVLAEDRVVLAEDRVVQAEDRVVQAEDRVVQAEDRVVLAEDRVVQAEDRVVLAEDRVVQVEDRVVQAEDRVVLAEDRVVQVEDRVVLAEDRVVQVEDRVVLAEDWVVQAEDRVVQAADWVVLAEDRVVLAEDRVVQVEDQEGQAEDRVVLAEDRVVQVEDQEGQAEDRVVLAEDRVVLAEDRVVQVEDQEGQAEDRVVLAEDRVVLAEDRVVLAEDRVVQVEDQEGQAEDQVVLAEDRVVLAEDRVVQAADRVGQAEERLRQKMLDIMIAVVNDNLTKSPQDIQALATALASLIKKGTEINTSAQEGAASLFANLSSSLLHMDLNATEVFATANNIVEGISNMLNYCPSKNTSDGLLGALFNIQSAMLSFMELNEDSSIIQQTHVKVFVRRVLPAVLYTGSVNITNCTCITFSLPQLPSTILPSDKPVDVRMLNLDVNPFCWKVGWDISRFVGSLSLTTKEGSVIPVENLSEDIQVVFPRFAGEQVNTTILDLGNFSTTVIDIPSANSTLVLKMMPSKVPLPFKVLLGYNDYPTETNYVAATEMPQQGATQEEKYTWLLHPEDLKGNTGVHYLVVRPIVGPGIKSINASLSITPITTSCKFWNESLLDWSNSGCRVGANTTHLETQCLCNHLTFFGNSFFVTPNLVDPSRTAELFATFANNPVVVCFVAALFLAYLLVLVWARRKDIQDTVKVKVTEVEDNDPMDEYRYLLSVCTGHRIGASTSSQVTVTLLGTEGHSEPHHLTDSKKRVFERGAVDMFLLTTPFSLGDLQGIRLWHNNSGSHPAWYVGNVMVQDLQTEEKWHFLCNSWLSVDIDDCSLDKIFPAASEMDLKRFSNLFFTKTTKDFKDGHLWISVISRPPSSHFTRVQRVSCCFSLLLCTMLTSIMFYGIPTDPSQQVMDLGSFEFTWQQFMIGVQSSLIMFPVNILIVSIFRFTRPREFSCCHRKKKKKNTQDSSATTDMTNSVSLDLIIKDITRIAHLLSKTIKSNVTCKEFKFVPEQDNDVNAILSVLKDLITQNNTASENIETKTQPQLSDSSASAEGVIQKKRNKSQYLYRQLCHIDSELSQLGPSGFPNPHSYKQALQQVQSMKELLEDQLVASNRGVPDEPTNKTASPSDSTDGDGAEKKRTCCHGGLPWWFIFVGWLLVIATSVVSGYFTMMYGLKFGKPRSISWLVSMVISFFQSVLLIQPLKVLCFAIFFALVIKKVDEEDFQNVQFERNQRNIGEQMFVRYGSVYEPPPHADVERMRRNRMLEQKAFALIREILIYMGFLWMLLLVAHGQRDPNAFYLNTHITQSFCGNAPATMAIQDVFNWASTSVLSNLFGQYPGFITDGNSKLLGNARLRQLRVKKNSCQIAGPMLKMVPDCSAPYSWEAEDMGSYGPGWNTSVGNNISASISSPWTYQTHSQLRAYPVWGELALYRGGGFSVELGPDLQTATSTLNYLFNNMWFDMYTRAIFVEFTVYNANVNLLCIVTLLLESPAVGAFQLNSEMQSVHLYLPGDGLRICIITTEIIYMLFILYYMFNQGKLMKQQRWLYFKNKWNLLELSIILLSWSAVAAFIQKTLIANRDIAYYQNHKDKFVSFYQTGTSESLFQYLMAFLVLLATVKLWHLLRLNPKMNMITAALQRAWTNISGLLLIIVIMLLAYSIACNVIYGWNLSSYKTFMDALMTLIGLQIGIFNYDEVLSSNPVLGGLLIGSCIVFVTFVVLNLLLSVILVAFNQEQKYHKPSEEEEIVDLMLMKICSLFGIKRKHAKDTRESDMSGGSGLAQNNNRNIFNTSSPDANIFQMSDKYVNP
ncbi:polycystic kidney disease protein 1-like 2 [Oreochromis aureus]|uniref:polycystic kidney disease protein 1-like 2 n=1 Tax=Oreochromis aureus TaxID=47969 RepID=UPI00195462C5|nr:polycystic kidney disease protein 1-like 2 [Oreochromis aureus]